MNRQLAQEDHTLDNDDSYGTKIFDKADYRDGESIEEAVFEEDDANMRIYSKNNELRESVQ